MVSLHSEDISPVPRRCRDLGRRLIHCSACVGTINLKQAGLDSLQSPPLLRTRLSQYQASSVAGVTGRWRRLSHAQNAVRRHVLG